MKPLNPFANRRLTTLDGTPASCLGLAAGPKHIPRCVSRAFTGGINYFFFYGPGNKSFIEELAALVRRKREQVIVATGSGSRRVEGLRAARRKLTALLGIESIDVFFIEYVHPGDNPEVMFGKNGVLDELRQWKESGWVRFVGATAHDRSLAKRLAARSARRCAHAPVQHGPSQGGAGSVPRRGEGANADRRVHGDTLGHAAGAVCGLARPSRRPPRIVTAIASLNRRCSVVLTAPRRSPSWSKTWTCLSYRP